MPNTQTPDHMRKPRKNRHAPSSLNTRYHACPEKQNLKESLSSYIPNQAPTQTHTNKKKEKETKKKKGK